MVQLSSHLLFFSALLAVPSRALFCWDFSFYRLSPGVPLWRANSNSLGVHLSAASPCEACARYSAWGYAPEWMGNRTHHVGYCPNSCRNSGPDYPGITTPNVTTGVLDAPALPDQVIECCGRDFCNPPFMEEYKSGDYRHGYTWHYGKVLSYQHNDCRTGSGSVPCGPYYSPTLDTCNERSNKDAAEKREGPCNTCVTARAYWPDGTLREFYKGCQIAHETNFVGLARVDERGLLCVRGKRSRVIKAVVGEGTAVVDCCWEVNCNNMTLAQAEAEKNFTVASMAAACLGPGTAVLLLLPLLVFLY